MFLSIGGSATGTNKASSTIWSNTETVANYGSPSDLWGTTTLTPAIINAANFGVVLTVKNSNDEDTVASVDYIQIIVSYSIAGTLKWYTALSGGNSIGSGASFNPVGVTGSGLTNTNTPGSTTYYVECSLNPGCRTPADFVINALPSTPQATNTNATCALATGSITITSPAPADGIFFTVTGKSPVVAAVTNTTGVFSGLAVGTYNVTANNASGCVSLPSADIVIKPLVLKPNTWNGTVWSTGSKPSSDAEEIIFNGDYQTKSEDLTACTCLVKAGRKVIIKEGKTLKLTNGLTVEDTVDPKTTLTFENNASLVQVNKDAVNKGVISYIRSNNTTRETDYTYWSSPVAGQKLIDVSPKTPLDYFYSFDAGVNNWIYEDPNKVVMKDGKGYIIRGPHHTGIPPTNFYDAPFKGVPNNGDYEVDIAGAGTSNLIGNPYPSALDAESFLIANREVLQGTLYFWTHSTPIRTATGAANEGSGDLVYITDDYASYNLTGGVGTEKKIITTIGNTEPSGENKSNRPTGKIASGQGFFATGKAAGKATFKNTMRVGVDGIAGDNMQFFKTTQSSKNTNAIEKNRVWLNLTNDKGAFKQVLVGYITDATNGYDNALDGANNNGNQFINFYSINDDKNLTIQARALPFDENDVVPLGYSSTIQGSFSISIDEVDGLLTSENIYLEDRSNNSIHDLKKAAYTFDTEKGTFNERFVLRYTDRTLASADFELNDSSVLIAKDKNELKIKSNTEIISQIAVFDLLGRKVFDNVAVNSNEFQTSAIRLSNQVVVVKVTLTNGEVISKKVVY
ncbi:hypothetical protein DR980_10985 [Flavobacterium psychrolimnae]|uniref:T9SS sorting signal type C domain-containing protein n=1 Tax=Flavobacterium psychrolimnae TaxID=249351 RepID=A0A366AYS1_9FLAO|nr:hypothetical protein DR980_10985 [Flavobacterium psychrolimnae]